MDGRGGGEEGVEEGGREGGREEGRPKKERMKRVKVSIAMRRSVCIGRAS